MPRFCLFSAQAAAYGEHSISQHKGQGGEWFPPTLPTSAIGDMSLGKLCCIVLSSLELPSQLQLICPVLMAVEVEAEAATKI